MANVKPLAKRPGGLTYVRPRYRGWRDRMTDDVAYPLFQRGSAGNPPPPPGGGGGREHGCSRPSPHSIGEARCPTHPPWGVGIRLVRGGVCRVSRWSRTGGTLPTCFRLRSFLLRSRQPCIRRHQIMAALAISIDVSGFVPNPCSLSSPLVKPLY